MSTKDLSILHQFPDQFASHMGLFCLSTQKPIDGDIVALAFVKSSYYYRTVVIL